MTKEYEYSVYDKKDHIYHFAVDEPRLVKAVPQHGAPKA